MKMVRRGGKAPVDKEPVGVPQIKPKHSHGIGF